MEFLLSQTVLIKSRNFLFLVVGLLTTVFLFCSCEKDNEFGIEINPDSNTLGAIYSDTFSIHTFSVISDSIRTDELNGPSPLGNYIDPVFGEVNASIITQIRLEQSYNFMMSAIDSYQDNDLICLSDNDEIIFTEDSLLIQDLLSKIINLGENKK